MSRPHRPPGTAAQEPAAQRLLADVWVGETMINADLVRPGYAQLTTVQPDARRQDLFVKLQRDARQAGRGFWKRA